MDLDARFGFVRWRVVGLALNLLANGVALYGAVRLLRDGTHAAVLAAGLALTAVCVALLALPDLRPEGEAGEGGEAGGAGAGRGGGAAAREDARGGA